jgi:Fe/S biogenesis protein NfuA
MSDAHLDVTEFAVQKLRTVNVGGKTAAESAIRIRVLENGPTFRYEFSFVELDTRTDDDNVVEFEELHFYVDSESLPRLTGSTLDYVDDLAGSGFKVDNPNKTELASNPLAVRVQEVLDESVNPGVAEHGGHVSLVGVEGSRVIVQFGGGCQGCGQAAATLKDGVVGAIRGAIPEVTEVVDTTDHAAGENPYY